MACRPPNHPQSNRPPPVGCGGSTTSSLDTARYELRRGDEVIRVEPQVFDVMTQLVSNHDRFVTKEELFDTVWGGRFVGEAALTSRIKAARRALGDDGESQRYIRTVRGRGYQFVGTIADAVPAAASAARAGCRRPVSTSRSAGPPTACGWRMRWRGRGRRWCGRRTG